MVFSTAKAPGTELLPKIAFLHLSVLYLRLDGSEKCVEGLSRVMWAGECLLGDQ